MIVWRNRTFCDVECANHRCPAYLSHQAEIEADRKGHVIEFADMWTPDCGWIDPETPEAA